jgi:hypothetical protein
MAKFKDPINENFEMPPAIFKMLSECTAGNFLLCYPDSRGELRIVVEFNSQLAELGIRSYVTKFLASIDTIDDETMTNGISGLNDDFQSE